MSLPTPPIEPWLDVRTRCTPQALALSDGRRTWTYAQLSRDVRHRAAHLAAWLDGDDYVAFLANTSAEYALWLMAAQALGIPAIPLNARLSAQELAAQLCDCCPRLLLYDRALEPLAARTVDLIAHKSSTPPRALDFDATHTETPVDGRTLETRLLPCYEPNRLATIMYTSGSTGAPKGVLQTFGNHGYSAVLCQNNLGFSLDDLWGCPTPLFHTSGLSILMRSLACGVGVRLYNRFDASLLNDELLSGSVTCLSAVTYQIERLLDNLQTRSVHTYPTTLQFVLQGGGPLSLSTLERCRAAKMPVVQSFGMTETASQVVALSTQTATLKPGSSGRPLAGVQLRIADQFTTDDAPLPPNTSGRILLKSPTIAAGYLNQPERFSSSFTEHGWFDTRDLGRIDEDGYLYVDCRLADLIVSGGENIYPAEVEAILVQHPSIAEAAVVGEPNERWGSVPVAVCIPRAPDSPALPSLEEVRSFCRQRLAPYKCPHRLVWVDALPITASGKLKRHAVLEMVASEGSRPLA